VDSGSGPSSRRRAVMQQGEEFDQDSLRAGRQRSKNAAVLQDAQPVPWAVDGLQRVSTTSRADRTQYATALSLARPLGGRTTRTAPDAVARGPPAYCSYPTRSTMNQG
jgi:hypothetical protein